ncbi:ribosomal protein S5 domain 2-like protein, partial [Russula dissimulans]
EQEEPEDGADDQREHAPILPLSKPELDKLYRFPLITRRVTQQTGKGKIHRRGVLLVVGNGAGLVGYGSAKHDDGARASNRAFAMAVRNMDYVDRFENRTIWTEMSAKLGATRILLRPRPVGFGLHCNPNVHQVLKAAGIKDISAKVWGSRNPLNVIKLLFRMLHAGNAPLAMGNGIGGPGRKLDKGSGVRGKQEIERERGRKLLNLRT